jgi:hypothetical protein
MNKTCPECGTNILGRIDKKFCSDMCRNTYNNKLKAENVNAIRNINNVLKKNRKILEELCPDEKFKTQRSNLLKKGFDFTYQTHHRKTQAGSVYYFLYDYGYLELENDYILIVKDNRN